MLGMDRKRFVGFMLGAAIAGYALGFGNGTSHPNGDVEREILDNVTLRSVIANKVGSDEVTSRFADNLLDSEITVSLIYNNKSGGLYKDVTVNNSVYDAILYQGAIEIPFEENPRGLGWETLNERVNRHNREVNQSYIRN